MHGNTAQEYVRSLTITQDFSYRVIAMTEYPAEERKVFITNHGSVCDVCKKELGGHAMITLKDKQVQCLTCANLDHLIFLPSGDASVTRRARKYSDTYAVVLKWSRARKRYERQGLLVEEEALAKAGVTLSKIE